MRQRVLISFSATEGTALCFTEKGLALRNSTLIPSLRPPPPSRSPRDRPRPPTCRPRRRRRRGRRSAPRAPARTSTARAARSSSPSPTRPRRPRSRRPAGPPSSSSTARADLEEVKADDRHRGQRPGMAWAIDPVGEQGRDHGRRERRRRRSSSTSRTAWPPTATRCGSSASRAPSRPYISGGQAITTGGSRCSLGFNVKRGGVDHFLTAGHCTNDRRAPGASGASLLGTVVGTSFPGNDYGIVRYTTAAPRPGNVSLYNGSYQDIATARNADRRRAGQAQRLDHRPAQRHDPRRVNQTVSYPQGVGHRPDPHEHLRAAGRQRRRALRRHGGAGPDLGRQRQLHTGGTTFFQPVTEALSVYGAQVY